MNKLIGFAGEGEGAVAALKSLLRAGFDIEILTQDENLINDISISIKRVKSFIDFSCDLVVCAGYKPIIGSMPLQRYTILNVHYSLLPLYRGLHSVVWSILNGDERFGYTVHLMGRHVDSGPIVYQKTIKSANGTSAEIMSSCHDHVEANLGSITKKFIDGKIIPIVQDEELATWVPKRNIEDCRIKWSWNADFIRNFIRALVSPYPLPYFFFGTKKIEISDATVLMRDYYCTTGRVVNVDDKGVYVKIDGGIIIIKEIKVEDEKIKANKFFRIGQRLT